LFSDRLLVFPELSIKWHPDKCKDDEAGRASRGSDLDCEATFKILASANEILCKFASNSAVACGLWIKQAPALVLDLWVFSDRLLAIG
jgi:hypothetical protein